MKAEVDLSLCEGHARCMESAPAIFEVGDDDYSHVLVSEIPEDQQDDARRAVQTCPRAAISLSD